MKRFLPLIFSFSILVCSFAFIRFPDIPDNSRISLLFSEWTGEKPSHFVASIDEEKAKIGKDLVHQGWAVKNGKKTKVISKYFVCTDCHNTVIEDETLINPTPEGRLRKSVAEDIPFLQGTTFYGITNRTSWYNEDYEKKYGSLVTNARDTLENAIQLCAKVCSSGRYLEDWELEAILHYYNTIDYKIADLQLTEKEISQLNQISIEEKESLLKSKFKPISSATFLEVQPLKNRKYGVSGNIENGKQIYKQSCLSCHGYEKDVAKLKLDTTEVSLKHFRKNLERNEMYSIYNIVRKGTTSDFAIKEYMPHYTAERMSEQQLEDLASYILY